MSPVAKEKTESEQADSLKALKDYIKGCGDTLVIECIHNVDDEYLLIVLRCRKYDIKSAFERIRRIVYARKKKYPEEFNGLYPSNFKHAFEHGSPRVLKHRDSFGRQILVFRSSYWNTAVVKPDELISMFILVGIQMVRNKETQDNGIVFIYDAGAYSLDRLRYITPSNIRKNTDIFQNLNPCKLKGAHIMNSPWIWAKAWSIVKIFISTKVRRRVNIHGSSVESLHKHFSPDILPTWLGGNLTDEEAFDHKLVQDLQTDETNEFYKKLLSF